MTLLFRALAAGVILSLALIHVIGEGSHMLEGVVEGYHGLGGCCAVFGVLLMVIMENLSHHFMSTSKAGMFHSHGHDDHAPHGAHAHSYGDADSPVKASQTAQEDIAQVTCGSNHVVGEDREAQHDISDPPTASDGHHHSCVAANTAANWASQAPPGSNVRDTISAYMFELGCVIHSFLIGLSLGVTVEGRSEVTALLIALCFHQCLEGIGLSSVLVKARFSLLKSLFMIFTYAVTTPLGVAIGIAVSNSYDSSSLTANAVQGVFDCVAGGLLLYISFVQLIAEDFTRIDGNQPKSLLFRMSTYGALALGAGCMAMLAIWA